MPISDLRAFLEDTIFHRPVIDQTGLTNKYDLDLAWEPAGHEAVKECLLEQLGLELVPARQRLEMLVIEPSTNSSKATQLAQVSPSSLGESFWNEPRLDLLPPVLLLRPTRFGFDNMSAYEDADAMGRVRLRFKYESLEYLLAAACDFKVAGGYCTWPSRMVLPPDLPRQRYDLLLTVPDAQEALQKEIRNRFHLTVRREVREVDALVIRDKAAEAPADSNKPTIPRNPVVSSAARGQPALWRQLPLWLIARNIEGQQGKPVLVQTASTNRFDLSIQPVLKDGKLVYDEEALKRAFRDQLGLEITSSREPVQMLVVERARD